MSRIVPAAVQFIEEVTRLNSKVAVKAVDQPDGYGRQRSIQFDARTSKWIVPAIEAMQDPRIAYVDYEGKGRAIVTWVTDVRADRRDDYLLSYVVRVLREDS